VDGDLAYTRKERASVFISTLFGYGLDFYNILIISFLMSAIQKSLGLTLTQAGVITSVTLVGSVIGGVFFGWIGDRVGRKTSLLLTLGLFSLGALASSFSWDFASLLFFRFVTGIGLGGEWGAGVVLFNEVWDRNRRGFGSALIQAASTAGLGAASVISIWALNTFSPDWGWRIALLTGSSPILLMVYVRFWMPESKLWLEYERLRAAGQLPPEKENAKTAIVEIFKGPSLRYTLIGFLMVSGYVRVLQHHGLHAGLYDVFGSNAECGEIRLPHSVGGDGALLYRVWMVQRRPRPQDKRHRADSHRDRRIRRNLRER
jgi:MFS family permease